MRWTPIASWRDAFAVYRHPRVIAMLFLGFSAGLPFLLVFSTLSAWLRDLGVPRTDIGFFAWVGITIFRQGLLGAGDRPGASARSPRSRRSVIWARGPRPSWPRWWPASAFQLANFTHIKRWFGKPEIEVV